MATTVRFDGELMAEDVALKGWKPLELAKRAKVADMTVYRFLRNERQTAPIAKKLARALGYRTAKRYLISSRTPRPSREAVA
jgi:plasmid maintenance system antidote protein VapI